MFEVIVRGVWDWFMFFFRWYKLKIFWEFKGFGIGGEEFIEYEILIEDMIVLSEELDKKVELEVENVKVNVNVDW